MSLCAKRDEFNNSIDKRAKNESVIKEENDDVGDEFLEGSEDFVATYESRLKGQGIGLKELKDLGNVHNILDRPWMLWHLFSN